MTVHSNLSIQRQLTRWVWVNHTISRCSKGGKGANHVTIIIASLVKDNFIELWQCTQIHLFKATYQLSMSESHHFTLQQVGKRSKSIIIASLVKDNFIELWQCTQIHLFKATYQLSMSESHHFTVQQGGKRSKSCYHYQSITRQG